MQAITEIRLIIDLRNLKIPLQSPVSMNQLVMRCDRWTTNLENSGEYRLSVRNVQRLSARSLCARRADRGVRTDRGSQRAEITLPSRPSCCRRSLQRVPCSLFSQLAPNRPNRQSGTSISESSACLFCEAENRFHSVQHGKLDFENEKL